MKAEAERVVLTSRVRKLTLKVESAADEMLLTELFAAFESPTPREIHITHAQEIPGKIFVWKP